jgi:nucleoside-diphosphate-sugar epimerase
MVERGHRVRALLRESSRSRLPAGCEAIVGDALHGDSYASRIAPSRTFVHLVGVSHPGPSKAAEFRHIDLKSCQEAVRAAQSAGVRHFVYLSVARPAPIMKEYQAVREEGERLVRESNMAATFVRPWYVMGPGHRWPLMLVPFYALARLYPPTREGANRLALVTLEQMVQTLAWAVEHPPEDVQIFEPPQIKLGAQQEMAAARRQERSA